ncbi:hypothetical protein HY230_01915 [Candidatus Acetothermia bacterium]|nr:hypothetical protein [Candidatus Acetothermia bacterium]
MRTLVRIFLGWTSLPIALLFLMVGCDHQEQLAIDTITFSGTIIDSATGKVIRDAVIIAMPPSAGETDKTLPFKGVALSMTHSDARGNYKLDPVPVGAQIQVLVPGYRKSLALVEAGRSVFNIALTAFDAKAIYITAATASSKNALRALFDLVDRTELNAVVVDAKLDFVGDVGRIAYNSQLSVVRELKTSRAAIDMAWLVAEAHRRGIYVIARIPVMRDDVLARAKPEWAIKHASGGLWADDHQFHWLDPFQPGVKDYHLSLAQEIAQMGFDEIQFDYIRFPSDGETWMMRFSQAYDPLHNPEPMYEAIVQLLKEIDEAVHRRGVFFSIDVFGYATWRDL